MNFVGSAMLDERVLLIDASFLAGIVDFYYLHGDRGCSNSHVMVKMRKHDFQRNMLLEGIKGLIDLFSFLHKLLVILANENEIVEELCLTRI